MNTIATLLEKMPRKPLTIGPNDTVFAALELMAKHNVGSLLIMDSEKLVGIFSERDYARKVVLHGKSSVDLPVHEVMTRNVLCVLPHQTVVDAMALMTDKRVRHLPVLDETQRVIGVVSIGDLVKETISEQAFIISQLETYIAS